MRPAGRYALTDGQATVVETTYGKLALDRVMEASWHLSARALASSKGAA